MEYITTFSFRSPQEKTELAPSGPPVKTEPPAEDNIAAAFFRTPPVFSHQVGALVFSAAAPELIADDFKELLERAQRANR
jgi:hypothetical protein